MKSKYIALLLIITSGLSIAHAQTKSLSIGDQMPDLTFSQTVNFKNPTLKISDYNGKLLILDFWATWCSPCVKTMPRLDSLQNEFDGKVQFLPVTQENRKTVEAFLNRLRSVKQITIPSIINDTLLNSSFAHSSIPFYVWVDKNGKIIATTEAGEITSKNISAAIESGNVHLKNRIEANNRGIDLKKQLFVPGIPYADIQKDSSINLEVVKQTDILYQSVLSKYIPDIKSKMHYDTIHFVATNSPIINFYRLYYGAFYYKNYPFIYWSKSRCKVEIKDTALYNKVTTNKVGQAYLQWSASNAYNYELVWKSAGLWKDKFDLLGSDLDKYFGKPFGIMAEMEKRMVSSDILTVAGDKNKLKTSGGKPEEKHDAFSYSQHNLPISKLINELEGYFWQSSDRPVFDETGFTGNVDIELNCNMNDIEAVNNELAKYDLKFIDGERMAEVLVIKERK